MRSTIVDAEGNVVCPVCGAKNQFTAKRTGKAKAIGVVTVGVGAVAMPKRLRCNGCGTNLKASGGGNKSGSTQTTASKRQELKERKATRKNKSLSPEERAATYNNPLDRAIAKKRFERQARKQAEKDG